MLGSCSRAGERIPDPTATAVVQESEASAPTEKPQSGPGSTALPPPAEGLEIEEVQLQIEYRCPRNATRDLTDLGLQAGSALLVSAHIDDDMRTWEVLDARGQGTAISLLHDAQGRIAFAGVSPGHGWIAYYAPGATDQLLDLWVGSLAGGEARRVMEGLKTAHFIQWISEEAVLVFHFAGGLWQVYSTWMILDTRTEERVLLPAIWLGGDHAVSPDGSALIYYGQSPQEETGWILHDLRTGKQRRVFLWTDDPIFLPEAHSSWIGWTEQGVSAARIGDTSITMALNIPEDALAAESMPLTTLVLPGEGSLSTMDLYSPLEMLLPIWQSPGNVLLPIWRGYGRQPDTEWEFFLIDTASWRAYDYCLAPWWRSPSRLAISPDSRFLSITRTQIDEVDSIVLDLQTGQRAELPDLGIWAWVLTSE
jgi:hypothetical protein